MSAPGAPEVTGTVVVGAGFAGIAVGLALQAAGQGDFVVLERAASVGGTWRDNTYPGVACDVPSHLYHLADHPHPDWSSVFAPGAEIRDYLEKAVADTGLTAHLRLDTPLDGARWTGTHWLVETPRGTLRADHLVLACGRLTEPVLPDVVGLDSFSGKAFHSSRWDHDTPVDGARVAVVGTGASAVQLVPELVRRGAEVTVFQRTPAWIVPRDDRPYDDAERAGWAADPVALRRVRDNLYAEGEARFASRSGDPAAAQAARDVALAHLAAQVSDPHLRAALTPAYAFGCKRVLLADDFYPALASGAATLVTRELAAVEGRDLLSGNGSRHPADVLVLATGFATTQQPYAHLVSGEGGVTLADHWATGMTAVASTMMSGFPNLYVLGGPNAALGHSSAVLLLEAQAELVARLVASGVAPVRVTADEEQVHTREVDERAAGTPWLTGGCRSWYVDDRSGRLTLLWPGTVGAFRDRLDEVGRRLVGRQAGSAS